MAFRFRRRIRLAPGIAINLGKRAVSVSLGRRGVTTNLGSDGARTTVGVPGTGVSYTSRSSRALGWVAVMVIIAVMVFVAL